MKRFLIIITVICIASFSIFMFSGCPTAPGYYIKFKLDGEQKNFDKGLTNYESKPFGEVMGDHTILLATPGGETGDDKPENYIDIEFDGIITGTFPICCIYIIIGGVDYTGSSGTVTVTMFEDEGGVIEGTFSGTVDSVDVTEGEFRVKRVPAGTLD